MDEITKKTLPLKAIPMLSKKEREIEAEKIRQEFVESKKLVLPPEIERKFKTRNFDR